MCVYVDIETFSSGSFFISTVLLSGSPIGRERAATDTLAAAAAICCVYIWLTFPGGNFQYVSYVSGFLRLPCKIVMLYFSCISIHVLFSLE